MTGTNVRTAPTAPAIDMDSTPATVDSRRVFTGRVFAVDERRVRLAAGATITRQVVLHAPVVVMLVHDVASDRYLLEREYRVGADGFAYGLPAGFIDHGETPREAAMRELREETGVVPSPDGCSIESVGAFRSSEGMTNEIAHVFVIDVDGYATGPTDPDPGEFVRSRWVPFPELRSIGITSSNSVIAIQAEELRRLRSRVVAATRPEESGEGRAAR